LIRHIRFFLDFGIARRYLHVSSYHVYVPFSVVGVHPWHEIAMSLRGAYLTMHRQADAGLAPYGLTADQFVVLAALSDGAVLTQAEVSRRTYSDPNTAGAMLALLAGRGLVRRMRHPADGRARTVALTPKGKRVFAKVWAAGEAFRAHMMALFGPADAGAFLRLLKRVIEELPAPQGRGARRKRKTSALTTDT
jgi:DNA-binding MarR family transcriptional regulator